MGYRVDSVEGFFWRGRFYPIMAGAEGDGGDAGSSDAGGGTDDGASKSDSGTDDGKDASDDGKKGQPKDRGDLNVALRESRREAAEYKNRLAEIEKREADNTRAAAEKAGEFEKLYADEKAGRVSDLAKAQADVARLEAEVRVRDAERSLLDVLGEKHPQYVGKLRWMLPVLKEQMALDPEADEAAREAIIKRVASDYVKDHPLSADGRGAPGGAGGNNGGNNAKDPMVLFPGLKGIAET